MSQCETVETYEMAPSDAAAQAPYNYYATWGHGEHHTTHANDNTWHSTFESEHDLWQKLSDTAPATIASTGRARIPGFHSVDCSAHKYDEATPPLLSLGTRLSASENVQKFRDYK